MKSLSNKTHAEIMAQLPVERQQAIKQRAEELARREVRQSSAAKKNELIDKYSYQARG